MPTTPPPIPRANPESVGLSPHRLERIGAALQADIAGGKLPGAVIAIVRHGKLAYLEAFGYLDRQAEVPMPADAPFSIASMTKAIVSVAALALYEEGRLLVNEPVSTYLPQFANMTVARADGPAVPAKRAMTI